ncbi:helix-turn-helix transcriptional regulator [Amycolatopsis saalfeldensis]|uniref:Predicted DNA-binding transcriptional regulator YafY, contains an HTH and WYL domains n=1 Tax=Amycolatopsis saalfeldensis TaxID=394193 RepID=A0A1H8YNJ6_9PSEU|nr:WYL domain-containing protein [Amycolatopsis saalfeldensis]SEP52948.1 Predicted DNA-binding transcriptional regulator YafY, contains an HTH and WYL domains [Amycolatopsis saalfeldensis]
MRAERLVALLFTLHRRRSATAASLAAELGVTERTMRRDLAALREAGVPLWSEPGRHGGVRLMDGWRSRLDGLTSREAVALLALDAPDALAGLGLGTAVAAAHAKVSAGLPRELREQAETVAARFHLDAPAWFRPTDEAAALPAVARAVWAQRRLEIRYQRRDKVASRVLEPLGLVLKAGVWYLVARIPDAGLRTYRVSRILAVEELGSAFERPADFDLARWWRLSSAEFEKVALPLRVRVRLDPPAVAGLRRVFGAEHLAEVLVSLSPRDAEGRADAELTLESHDIAVGQLVSLGPGAEVLHPPEVRAAVAAVGAAIAARNS